MLNREMIQQMKQQLKTGVVVVFAPQLFPTPPGVARRLVDLADIRPGMSVLEPSAGTGRILDALQDQVIPNYGDVVAVELDYRLAQGLASKYNWAHVIQDDFLNVRRQFDRIVMNPPFKNGEDIKHITHAVSLLRPGGRVVAICANGPRQQKAFSDHYYEPLSSGTFSESGTSVNSVIVIIDQRGT